MKNVIDKNAVEQNWEETKTKIKKKWKKFSEDDVNGFQKDLELVRTGLVKTYGHTKECAEKEFNDFKSALKDSKSHANSGKEKLKSTLLQAALIAGGFGIAENSFAQSESSLGFNVGLVGIGNMQNPTKSKGAGPASIEGTINYGLGLTTEFVFNSYLSLEADLLLLKNKFSQNTAEFFGANVKSNFSSNYIQIPVLVRFKPISFVNLGAGLYYSRVYSSWSVSANNYEDKVTDYGKNDIGLALALGTEVPLANNLALMGDVRYTKSLSEVSRSSGDALKYSNIQALVGVKFSIN